MVERVDVDPFGQPRQLSELTSVQREAAMQLSQTTTLSIQEAEDLVARTTSPIQGADAMKQIELLTSMSKTNISQFFKTMGFVLFCLGLLILIGSIFWLLLESNFDVFAISEIPEFLRFSALVCSCLILIGGFFYFKSDDLGKSVEQLREEALSEALAFSDEMQDTDEDLRPIYVDDRRHQW